MGGGGGGCLDDCVVRVVVEEEVVGGVELVVVVKEVRDNVLLTAAAVATVVRIRHISPHWQPWKLYGLLGRHCSDVLSICLSSVKTSALYASLSTHRLMTFTAPVSEHLK